jgi:DNA-binding NarL/FixJ family response regulator
MKAVTQEMYDSLSPRKKEIIELVCQGMSNREIADKLCIAEKTVKFHMTHIFLVMGVRNRTSLAVSVRGV